MDYFLTICIFVVALLYSAVGQGGGSGYVAVMALFALPAEEIRPTALILNIVVSGIAVYLFYRAGSFSWKVFLPLTILSLPFAFIGGLLTISPIVYGVVVGTALIVSAYYLFRQTKRGGKEIRPIPMRMSFAVGSSIGLVSGATGLGGGIFLSPLLLLKNWADARHVPGISAGFIFVNSISALSGYFTSVRSLPEYIWILVAVALLGGLINSHFGSHRAGNTVIIKIFAGILLIAGVRLILAPLF